MDYDHEGRLTNTWHKIGRILGGTFSETSEVLLAQNTYNELGQLIDKKLHSTVADASNAKQSVDYRYNIRGWLTSINNAELSNTGIAGTNDDNGDLFGMNLAYNDDLGTGNAANPQYNGNINAVKWSTSLGSIKEMAYNFTYDPMNRLVNAYHQQAATLNTWSQGQYDEYGLSYDLNGNIATLQRLGNGRAPIDNLAYACPNATGNQLQSVTDAAPASDKSKGFYDGYTGTGEYIYDANGNLIVDRNKNLVQSGANPQAIFYNYLNLPEKVCKYGSDNIVYVYDAAGVKRAQVVTQSNTQKNTEYVGPWVFEDNVLQFIQHDEGRVVMAKEQLLYINSCDAPTSDMQATGDPSRTLPQLASQTINGEKYVQVTCKAAAPITDAIKPGLTFGTVYSVSEGERYRFRVKGYFNGTLVTLNVKGNGTDLLWPGTSLSRQPISESWVEQIILVPAGVSQLTLGILWNGATTANSDNFLINEVEFYQLSDNSAAPEYQYNIKDHLGNVRVSFTTIADIQSDVATMEPANQLNETKAFVNYEQMRVVKSSPIFDHTNNPGGNGASIRLSGNANEKTGLVKTLSVMPGDVIHMEVYAKYLDPNTANWDAALTTLVSNISAGSTSVVSDGPLYNTNTSSPFPYTGLNGTGSSTGSGPKAFLNYITFDKDFNPILPAVDPSQTNYKRMGTAGQENGKNNLPDGVAHEQLVADVTIKQPGYMYIYLSNEESTPLEVYFDDFKVTQTKSAVIQTQDYYPFGLTFNSSMRENSVPNQYQYNGKELQNEMNIGWLDYGARMYMPEIGKWSTTDPLCEKYLGLSLYSYVANNPVSLIDPNGKEIWLSYTYRNENNEEVTTRLQYRGKKLYDKDGKEYKGTDPADPIFQLVKDQLDFIQESTEGKEGGDEIKKLFSDLESSEADHDIVIGLEPYDKNKKNGNRHDYTKLYPFYRGSTIHFNPTDDHDPDEKLPALNPIVGLLHELQHAQDTQNWKSEITTGGYDEVTGEQRRFGSWEFRAVNTENIIRKAMGIPLRTSYWGVPVPAVYITHYPN